MARALPCAFFIWYSRHDESRFIVRVLSWAQEDFPTLLEGLFLWGVVI